MSLEEIRKELERKRGSVEIKMPDKTIKVQINFWTDNISSDNGKKVPRVCWDFGTIHVLENKGHGIERLDPIPFNSLSELIDKIEEGFTKAGVKVLKSKKDLYYP